MAGGVKGKSVGMRHRFHFKNDLLKLVILLSKRLNQAFNQPIWNCVFFHILLQYHIRFHQESFSLFAKVFIERMIFV